MVFTLHRYIFFDLVKTFCQATLILCLILGLGIMLQFLRQFSVDPIQVPKLITYTFPITLTMVIPIAALLSATLNYGRLSHFNEINACRTSGIRLLSLIYPAVAFALLVGLATLLLGFHVVPSFAKKFEQTITADAEAIIFSNILKRGDLGDMFPNIRVYADHAIPEEHRLMGVVVLQLNRQDIEWIVTAEQVELEFKMDQPQKQVFMHLYQATLLRDGQSFYYPQPRPMAITIPSLWQDNIKFKNLKELRDIQNDMAHFGPIQRTLQEFQQQYTWEKLFERCDQQARSGNAINLNVQNLTLRIFAEACRREFPQSRTDQKDPAKNRTAQLVGVNQQPVEVIFPVETDVNERGQIFQARQAWLTFDTLFPNSLPKLDLRDVTWRYADQTNTHSIFYHPIPGINFPSDLVTEAQTITLKQIQDENVLVRLENPSPYLQWLQTKIMESCMDLIQDIRIEKHSRLAFGVSCVVLVFLGTVLGIILRSSHLLMAFGISFIPAAFCLITIFTGKHIAEKTETQTLGILFLWSGIIIVALADTLIYRRLAKC